MSISSLQFAAETYLRILRDDPDRSESLEAYYVRLAVGYGIGVERIAELTEIPLNRVARLLGSAA